MLNLERSTSRQDIVDTTGEPFVLVSQRLTMSLRRGRAGLAAAYLSPVAIERDGARTPIRDLVLIAKLVGMLVVALAMLVRTVRP